ncbi:MAG TPA: hypothetical protein VMW20_07085 [Candidatus Nanoarchaeia archaeon]|nr:hypothetical protein [Candidatus Nanoarchaeia archaeon]
MFRDEAGAVGLPMRMVVLTIVGMAGLASMIIVIGDLNLVHRSMHGDIISIENSTTSSLLHANNGTKNVTVEVIDVDGSSVERATVVIFGLDSSASGRTNRDGYAVLVVNTSSIKVVGEGYLKLVVKADGFSDYQNDYALKVVND